MQLLVERGRERGLTLATAWQDLARVALLAVREQRLLAGEHLDAKRALVPRRRRLHLVSHPQMSSTPRRARELLVAQVAHEQLQVVVHRSDVLRQLNAAATDVRRVL